MGASELNTITNGVFDIGNVVGNYSDIGGDRIHHVKYLFDFPCISVWLVDIVVTPPVVYSI